MVKGASRWVLPQVERVVSALRGAGMYQVPADPLPPTCYLILSCVKQNKQEEAKPLTFRLKALEDLARALSRIPPGEPLFAVHVDLKNAFWFFRLPPPACRIFGFRPGPGMPTVELEHLPFGWKYSPYFCQTAVARVLLQYSCALLLQTYECQHSAQTQTCVRPNLNHTKSSRHRAIGVGTQDSTRCSATRVGIVFASATKERRIVRRLIRYSLWPSYY